MTSLFHCSPNPNLDRDNVPPSFLTRLYALLVEHMRNELRSPDANASWVRAAVDQRGEDLSHATAQRLADLRFGDRRVAFDPSDPEANSRAVAAGYQVVHGGALSAGEWALARRAGAIPPAGQVTPSPKPYSTDGTPLRLLDRSRWTPAIAAVVAYVERLSTRLVDAPVSVDVANDATWPFAATYGDGLMRLNLGRLGHAWFEAQDLATINALVIHELGHHYESDHLSARYHDALCKLAGRLSVMALEEPALFDLHTPRLKRAA
jgi:hypothetical protein